MLNYGRHYHPHKVGPAMSVTHSYADLPARSKSPVTLRLVGLLIAVCVPTAFWVLALKVVSAAAGVTISPLALTVFGLAIACCCFVGAAIVMAGSDGNSR